MSCPGDRLSAWLDAAAAEDRFSGVVLLARDGKPVFERAYGMADREARTPNRVDTAFNLGSINKVFTATAIRQLAASGKLALDAPLRQAWPDYPNADAATKVTVQQIIGYSNAGYVVLGALVERASGEDYDDYVRKHVFEPAGMTHTASIPRDAPAENTAVGYTRGGPGAGLSSPLRRNSDLLPGRGSAAGGGYSTAQDLHRFVTALREGRVPGGPPPGLGAAGGAPGVNAMIEAGMPGGYDLIVLANLDPPAAEAVGREVRGWLGAPERGGVRIKRPQ